MAISGGILIFKHAYVGVGSSIVLPCQVWAFSTLGYRQQPLVLALAQQVWGNGVMMMMMTMTMTCE
jgi:hypothetical protein